MDIHIDNLTSSAEKAQQNEKNEVTEVNACCIGRLIQNQILHRVLHAMRL